MKNIQLKIYNDLSFAQIDLLNAFNTYKVRFIIIGGYSLIYHGMKRKTADLDLLVSNDLVNVKRIIHSFKNLKSLNIDLKNHLSLPRKKITWYDVEIITPDETWNFDDFYSKSVKKNFNKLNFFFLSIKDSIKLKEESDREKDLADLKYLKSITH